MGQFGFWEGIAMVAGGVAGALLVRAGLRRGPSSSFSRADAAGGNWAVLAPRAGSLATAQRIRALAAEIEKVWPDVTGRAGPVPPGAMELLLAQAAAEGTSFGQSRELYGNVGSYQCGQSQGTSYYDCVAHGDSRPNADGSQTKYTATFRRYKDGVTPDGKSRSALEAGAWDFVQSVTVKPFPALDQILAGDVLAYARKQFGQHYFEAFNLSPAGLAAYAPWVDLLATDGVPLFRSGRLVAMSASPTAWKSTAPPGSPSPERVAGRIVFYAAAMARNLPEIAAALGHTKVEARVAKGLEQPWQPRFQAPSGQASA